MRGTPNFVQQAIAACLGLALCVVLLDWSMQTLAAIWWPLLAVLVVVGGGAVVVAWWRRWH